MKKPEIKILYMEQPEVVSIGKQKWRLLKTWRAVFSVNGKIIMVICDKGAEWDGASMPRFSWSALCIYPGGRMLAPSLPHDGWCLGHCGNKPKWFHVENKQKVKIPPYIRDLIFKESCRHVGILKRRAKIMWFSVMLFQRFDCMRRGIKYK